MLSNYVVQSLARQQHFLYSKTPRLAVRPRATVALAAAMLLTIPIGATLPLDAEAQLRDLRDRVRSRVENSRDRLESTVREEQEQMEHRAMDAAEETLEPLLGSAGVVTDEAGNPIEAPELTDVTTEQLGSGEYVISDDGAHAAVLELDGSRQTVRVNGTPGPAFDQVLFDTFRFSRTGGRYAYAGRRGDQCIVVRDGSEIHTIDSANCDRPPRSVLQSHGAFHFTEDGTRVAYAFLSEPSDRHAQNAVAIDGEAGPLLPVGRLELTARGNRIFYATEERVYVNHEPDPQHGSVQWPRGGPLMVTEDGEHYAYTVTDEDGQERVVINGIAGAPYSNIITTYMHTRNGAVLYRAAPSASALNSADGEGQVVVFGDRTYPVSELGVPTSERSTGVRAAPPNPLYNPTSEFGSLVNAVAISPDGSRFAYLGSFPRSQRSWVVVDGERGLEYETVSNLRFTADSETVLYTARNLGQWFAIVNGVESGPYDDIGEVLVSERGGGFAYQSTRRRADSRPLEMWWTVNGTPSAPVPIYTRESFVFSPDGSSYAFAGSDGENFVEIDRERHAHQYQEGFLFSADSERIAYVINAGRGAALVVDGRPITAPENEQFQFMTFSPEGGHVAYLRSTRRHGQSHLWTLYVDGRAGPVVGDGLIDNPNALSFVNENTVRVVAMLEGELVRNIVTY